MCPEDKAVAGIADQRPGRSLRNPRPGPIFLSAPGFWASIGGMTPAKAQQRIADLRAQVAREDELYYKRAKPELSDFEYDALQARAGGPGGAVSAVRRRRTRRRQRVGDDRVQGFKEVAHRQKMLSLDNTYNEAELRAFHARLAKLLGTR